MLDFTKIPNWPQRRIIFLPNQDETYPTIEACNKKMHMDIGANQMLAEVETALTSLVEEGKIGRVLTEVEMRDIVWEEMRKSQQSTDGFVFDFSATKVAKALSEAQKRIGI